MSKMKLSFRWYGEDDKVTLDNIRQIPGMHSIVTAVYDVPVGEVWPEESIARLKKQVEDKGLNFEAVSIVYSFLLNQIKIYLHKIKYSRRDKKSQEKTSRISYS